MKVLVVLILVLLPAGLAAFLLLGGSPSSSTPIRRIETAPTPEGPGPTGGEATLAMSITIAVSTMEPRRMASIWS